MKTHHAKYIGSTIERAVHCATLCAALVALAAHATPQTVGDEACPKYAVDIAAFATCEGDRVVVPDAGVMPGPPVMLVDDEGNPMLSRAEAIPRDPLARTAQGNYLTAADAFAAKHWLGESIFFVDVRAVENVRETGMPQNADINVPLNSPTGSHDVSATVDFVAAIRQALTVRHLSNTAPVLIICEDGRHAAIAATRLAQANVPNVFVVRGGMIGEKSSSGEAAGWIFARLPMRAVITA